jgi:hypothetical protein
MRTKGGQNFAGWNRIDVWLRQLDGIRRAALHRYPGQRREDELARTLDATRAPSVWESLKRSDTVDDCAGYSACGIGIRLGM